MPEKIKGLKQNQSIILLGILLLDVPLSLLASFATNFPRATNDVICITVVGAHCPSFNVENTLIDLLFWYTLFFVFSVAIFRKKLLLDKLIKIAIFIFASVLISATIVSLILTQTEPLDLSPSPQPPSAIPTPKTTTTSAKKDETANWNIYSNESDGFKYELKYPKEWTIVNDPKDYNQNQNYAPEYSARKEDLDLVSPGYELSPTANTIRGTALYIYKPVDKFYQESLYEHLKKELSAEKLTIIPINGNQAVSYDGVDPDDPYTAYEITNGSRIISMSRHYPAGKKSEYEDITRKILSTFKFLD